MDQTSLRESLPGQAYYQAKLEKLRGEIEREDRLPDPVDWIQTNFYIIETRAPLTLAKYQAAALRAAMERDETTGLFKYSTIVWSDLKKSAKTTIAGAVSLYFACNRRHARIRLVGNDLKQADSRVFQMIADCCKMNPELAKVSQVTQHAVKFKNGSVIESVPVDPSGEAGGNDDLVEWTELWAANGQPHQKMWSEMTLSPLKYGRSFRWTDTYAGYTGESPILEQLYQTGVKEGRKLDLRASGAPKDLEVFANDAARLFVLWNTEPRLPWQTPEYYAQEQASLTESEFLRLHRNQWTMNSEEIFVPSEWWEACQVEIPPIKRETLFVSMDAGISSDCFAIVAASRVKGKAAVRYARAWYPKKGQKLEFRNEENPDDPDYPEGELLRLIRRYNVIEVCYDPYQLHDMATRLKGKANFYEFSQGSERALADKQLRDAIRDRNLLHNGDHELTKHVRNANIKHATEISKLRLVKRAPNMKIDLAVAMSMAVHRCLFGATVAEEWLAAVGTNPQAAPLEENDWARLPIRPGQPDYVVPRITLDGQTAEATKPKPKRRKTIEVEVEEDAEPTQEPQHAPAEMPAPRPDPTMADRLGIPRVGGGLPPQRRR